MQLPELNVTAFRLTIRAATMHDFRHCLHPTLHAASTNGCIPAAPSGVCRHSRGARHEPIPSSLNSPVHVLLEACQPYSSIRIHSREICQVWRIYRYWYIGL